MIELTLYRMAETDDCTLGRIETPKCEQLCVTMERPWVDDDGNGLGDRNRSRIPAGRFRAFRRLSPSRGYELFELEGVPGRSNIQIHKGNLPDDSLGCIIVGSSIGKLKGQRAVLGSAQAFERFMDWLKNEDEFWLVVKDPGEA